MAAVGPKIPYKFENLNLSPGFQFLDTLECLSNQGVA
jgi:hypothetical protein